MRKSCQAVAFLASRVNRRDNSEHKNQWQVAGKWCIANIVRGFRRLGWVIAVPLAALLLLTFFEGTKELSPSDYVVIGGPEAVPLEQVGASTGGGIEMPGIGY